MPTTLIQHPGDITMSRNETLFQFRVTDSGGLPYGARAASAQLTTTATNRLAAGATVTVTITDPDALVTTVVFTASNTPSTDLHLPTSTFVGTDAQYWAQVAAVIGEHRQIAPWAIATGTVATGTATLKIQARNTGTGWTIGLANSAGYSVTTAAAVADNTPDNLALLVEVFVERTYKGGDYRLAGELQNTPDTDGYVLFDVSSILEAEARTWRNEPLVPVYGTNTPYIGDNLRRYYVRYTTQQGNPVAVAAWATDALRLVMWGGVSHSIWAEGNYLNTITLNDSLLTWLPNGWRVPVSGPLYIGWYNYLLEAAQTRIQVERYSVVDGSLIGTTTHYGSFAVAVKETAVYPCDLTTLALSTTNVYMYRLRVQYLDDALVWQSGSEWRTYYIDDDYVPEPRYIQYLNNFGVAESVRCTGLTADELNVERSVVTRNISPGDIPAASDTYQHKNTPAIGYTYRTGYLRKADAQVLQEMLISGEIYEVSAAGYIPLRITSNSFQVTETQRDLHAYQFEATLRRQIGSYSKRPVNPGDAANAWQEPDGSAWLTDTLQPWELP